MSNEDLIFGYSDFIGDNSEYSPPYRYGYGYKSVEKTTNLDKILKDEKVDWELQARRQNQLISDFWDDIFKDMFDDADP